MKKKIVLFIPSIEGGGVEKNLFLIAEHLSKIHKKLYIITADKKYKNILNKIHFYEVILIHFFT